MTPGANVRVLRQRPLLRREHLELGKALAKHPEGVLLEPSGKLRGCFNRERFLPCSHGRDEIARRLAVADTRGEQLETLQQTLVDTRADLVRRRRLPQPLEHTQLPQRRVPFDRRRLQRVHVVMRACATPGRANAQAHVVVRRNFTVADHHEESPVVPIPLHEPCRPLPFRQLERVERVPR